MRGVLRSLAISVNSLIFTVSFLSLNRALRPCHLIFTSRLEVDFGLYEGYLYLVRDVTGISLIMVSYTFLMIPSFKSSSVWLISIATFDPASF